MKIGKLLMTVVLVAQAVSGFALDWTSNHLLSPLWHPHAKFHGALLLFLLSGVSATALWLLWRKSKEPEIALTTAVLLSLSPNTCSDRKQPRIWPHVWWNLAGCAHQESAQRHPGWP